MSISREAVEGSSPDAASLKAAQKLGASSKLSALGREGDLAWGDIAGSGSAPYHVAFDGSEAEVAWKCSCPSRKIPCKHSLALALRFADKAEEFEAVEKPSWVSDWQKNRAKRASKVGAEPKPVDTAAQAKRVLAREEKVTGGLRELELWLRDVMRGGIVGLPAQPYEFWDKIAARMTDAQCAGLARRLRDMASVPHQNGAGGTGRDWQEEMLHRLAGLHLVAEGYKRLESLGPERAADVRALIGWNIDQNELLQSGAPVRDLWLSLSYTEEVSEDGLRSGKTWLWGRDSNRTALVIQFGFGGAAVGSAAPVGTSFSGDLVFFPGSLPLRALVKEKFGPPQSPGFAPRGLGQAQVLAGWAQALCAFPWLESWPCVAASVVPARVGERMWAVGDDGALPLDTRRVDEWALLASSGGRSVGLFGLWNGRALEPLAALQQEAGRVVVTALPAQADGSVPF